ncbi:MAG: tRNA (N(6)-L-threonylcarbamoyladenosine(37)-C(2))-methylthiotransferase MtaB [Bacteroidales bacterium]|nr:tRNA (N(6)-L-threonylcarbamoyladenosine(37)-C(2))-methylthiotransferase MtaB [Bacteroidales bacterium]
MTEDSILKNKKVVYYTLGCKLNFAETSTIGKMLAQRGVVKAKGDEQADVCIINTCSVTELADKKCRQTIRSFARQHPNAYVVVTGCYAQLKSEEVGAIDGVDLVLGAAEKMDLPDKLEAFLQSERELEIDTTPLAEIKDFAPSCSRGDRTRYFLKVQDGCDYYCSYCTIPFARGRSRNGSIASMVEQAKQVAEEGGKEIVITGVNIGDFGKTTGESFLDLIKALDEVKGIERYRISSIEPDLLTDEAIEFIATSKRIAPHFHIPLQSGSDEVLKIMRRHYDKELFCSKIKKIKEVMPDAFIGVDLIVGMRGETEPLFAESFATVEGLDISQLHVFTYSERPGTRALKIEHVVTPQEKHDRCTRMLNLSEKKRLAFYKSQIGKCRPVLFEQPGHGFLMHGFTDNYIRVEMPYDKSLVNCSGVKVLLGDFNEEKSALKVEKLFIEE